ncbi:MAG TPA: CRISPR-associated endonuclease Cas2 [Clostridia bacterium]|nr:CRISPR-associated endonuclease Cas2 [Clostridia bacterium]
MLVLVSYDVRTDSKDGVRRLRRVARHCENHGQRVQNSVFECLLDPAQWAKFHAELLEIADLERDSLRFYFLGANWQRRVEHIGIKPSYDPEGPLLI